MFSSETNPDPEDLEAVISDMIPSSSFIFRESSFQSPGFPLILLQDVCNFYKCLDSGEEGMIDEQSVTYELENYLDWIWWVLSNDVLSIEELLEIFRALYTSHEPNYYIPVRSTNFQIPFQPSYTLQNHINDQKIYERRTCLPQRSGSD